MDNQPLQLLNLGSISGITLCSLFIVELLKRLFQDKVFFKKIPVFVYAVSTAIILAFVANRVLKTDNGSPILAGEWWKVVWAAIQSSAAASGFYTWLRPQSVEKAMADGSNIGPTNGDVMRMLLVLLLPLMLLLGGCRSPEVAVIREGMDQTTRTIREQHKDWASKLVAQPDGSDKRAELPQLTPNQYNQILKTHQEYEDLVNEDRLRDKGGN